jgi:toxin ParE1/3/4
VVVWTQPAKDDLRAIYEYIALDSKFYARSTARNIVERTAKLSDTPNIGRVVPDLDINEIREVFIYSYRIIYQIIPAGLAVLTVVYGHRDLKSSGIPVIS